MTVLNPHDYADHHFLFHLLQIPFLWFFEPVTAAKVAAITFSTLAIFPVFSMLFPYGVNHVSVTVRAGDVEISMHMAGPDHAHGDEEMDWPQDDLFDDDGEVP